MELEITLSNVINQLAHFFSVSVETITQNAPQWLAIYGRYALVSNLSWGVFVTIFILIIVEAIFVGLVLFYNEELVWGDD